MGTPAVPSSFLIDPPDLFEALLGTVPPLLVDVGRRELVDERGTILPAAWLLDAADAADILASEAAGRRVVVACAHGHNRSQGVAAALRARGIAAQVLRDGFDSWLAAGLPVVRRRAGPVVLGEAPTSWVTRRRPKIDRVACPWLIARFLDARARFLFVEPDQVLAVADDLGGIAYDLPGAPFEHDGELCSFDALVRAFGLDALPELRDLALIVRGADTDRLDLVPQCAGLLAVALGLSARHGDDDAAVLRDGFIVYDGLLAWLRHARGERHLWVRPARETAA
ncbi:chromate resistance protein [Chelatococcus sp. SYSU_G07232]|uniref:Chromate resistance protein n=1 Tax=Chelatococcus albus TaxID=3047466 RepID=A0ABT7AG72_9HYPH|nr:chromate resistance protein ChrB domain-containing protein [Chelatococcus sp. SYSU_G07232]MDJ1158373.1 chromate resistance protein [Chelatococcus sp. SYSU_G07232]